MRPVALICFIIFTGSLVMASIDPKELIRDCPKSPNCVSTLTDQQDKKMDAIPITKSAEEVMVALKAVISKEGGELLEEDSNFLHFLFKTTLLRFKDDVYFYYDSEGQQLHFKSQSRSGYSDLGKNRSRMKSIVKKLKDKI